MIVVRRRGAADGKAPKAVFALDARGSDIQSAPIQGLPERQLVPTAKRRVCFVIRADVVAVAPAHRTVARVKLASHLGRRGDPDVRRQHGVQGAPQFLNAPPVRHPNTDRLSSRVHSGVGPSRAQRGDWRAHEALQCRLQNALDGARLRLALPSTESGPVIVQHELHGAFGHRMKARET